MRAVVFAAAVAAAAPAGAAMLHRAVEVDGWAKGRRADPDAAVRVMLSLKSKRPSAAAIADHLAASSNPASPTYGQHLTAAEVAAITAPPSGALETVLAWLRGEGAEATPSRWGDRVDASAPVSVWERAFATEWHEWTRGGQTALQAGDVNVPAAVAEVVEAVFGAHGTPLERRRAPVSSAADPKVTPAVLRQLYNVSGVTPDRSAKMHAVAVAEFQNQYVSSADVDSFFKTYLPDAKSGDSKFTCVGDHCEPQGAEEAGVEASLDLQYIMGVATGVPAQVWMYNSPQWCYDLKNWTTSILDHSDPPRVFSVSYGIQGNVSLDKTQGCDTGVVLSIEQDFAKISAMGVTLVFSSGDSGSGGEAIFHPPLWPVWPGSAPHVTAVGATRFSSGVGAEEAVTKFGSGGGFSWRWPAADWQRTAVEAYLSNTAVRFPKQADFPKGGRATPDIAGIGEGYQVITAGRTQSVGGTSASAPMFAGMVGLVNEARRQKGKTPVGYINPAVYAMAGKGWTDVTKGNNRIDRSGIHVSEGYDCTPGWDAVTGWGTPRFQELLEYFINLE